MVERATRLTTTRPWPSADPLAAPHPHPTVFLAEDDTAMRRVIARALRHDGYEVVEATDGTDLFDRILDRIEATRASRDIGDYACDVIVSDIRMPGLSGLDVLALLRSADCAIPVVLITAFGDAGVHAEARELGAVAVFDKPFDIDYLRAAVRAAVNRSQPG